MRRYQQKQLIRIKNSGDSQQKIYIHTGVDKIAHILLVTQRLAKKVNHAKTFPPEPPWECRLIEIVKFLLPKTKREEWVGDFREMLHQMRAEERPRWQRICLSLGRICLLGIALMRIRLSDLRSSAKRKTM